jgi:hypothetical protein
MVTTNIPVSGAPSSFVVATMLEPVCPTAFALSNAFGALR